MRIGVVLKSHQRLWNPPSLRDAGSCCMSASNSSSFRWIEMAFGNMLPIKGCHERTVQASFLVFLNDLCARGYRLGALSIALRVGECPILAVSGYSEARSGAPTFSGCKSRRDIRDRGGCATFILRAKIIPAFISRQSFRGPGRAWLPDAERICGSILSLSNTANMTASKVAALVLKPNASMEHGKARLRLGCDSPRGTERLEFSSGMP